MVSHTVREIAGNIAQQLKWMAMCLSSTKTSAIGLSLSLRSAV